MGTYETIIIFSDKLTKEEYSKLVKKYTDIIYDLPMKTYKVVMKSVEELGMKMLAYPIKKCKQGWYAVFTYKINPECIGKLEEILHKDDDVLKFITVKESEDEDYETEDAEYIPDHPEKDVESEQSSTIDALDVMLGLAEYKRKEVR